MSGSSFSFRVVRLAIAGGLGGFLAFLLVNPALSEEEQLTMNHLTPPISLIWRDLILMGVTVGCLVGVGLVLGDELIGSRPIRAARLAVVAAAVGAAGGAVGTAIAQSLFGALVLLAPVVVARTLGWSAMGLAAGLCPAAAYRSRQRAAWGAVGGLVGGAAGGLVFDAVAFVAGTGSPSRLIGLVLMGAAIGAAVALVEEAAKSFWVTVLTGAREGRTYLITRPVSVIGRDELADVPLFGDASVARQHAVLVRAGDRMTLQAAPGQTAAVGPMTVTAAELHDGDVIRIGRHQLRFRSRAGAAAPVGPETIAAPVSGMPAWGAEPGLSATPGAQAAPSVQVLSGPHAGAVFALTQGAIIGRDPRCDIALTRDGRASRQHARLLYDGYTWSIEDGGSTNGTWVNESRVTTAPLRPGDSIRVGETVMRMG